MNDKESLLRLLDPRIKKSLQDVNWAGSIIVIDLLAEIPKAELINYIK